MLERALPVGLNDLLAREISLPVCPVVFIKLTEALEHADDRNFNLPAILSADTALTSQVLRAANSAVYGLVRQVRSVDEAIFRIGFRDVWAIAAALKAKEMYRAARPEWSRMADLLWTHALNVAATARALSKRCLDDKSGELFTAGILHDLGKLILHQVSPQYGLLTDNGVLRGHSLILREQDFFGTHHARIGGELLQRWNLPVSLAQLVDHHHDDVSAGAVPKDRALLMLANDLAHILDACPPPAAESAEKANESPELPAPEALAALSPECLAAAGLDAQQCWQSALTGRRQTAALDAR